MKIETENKLVSTLVWMSITAFYCYQLILRSLPNIIMPEIMAKYTIGASEFGSYSGIYYVSYIVVHIPIGLLLAHFGGKKVLPICIALTALGLAPIVYSNLWESVIVGRVLTGIGSSAAIVGALQTFRIIYPTKFSRMLGFTVFFGLLTAVYMGSYLTKLIQVIGIDRALHILFYAGIILALITFVLMPKSAIEESKNNNIWLEIKAIICNPIIILSSLFAGLMIGPLEGFADAWGSAFFGAVYGIKKIQADYFTLSMYLGMCIGCITLPYIADKTNSHIELTIFSGVVMFMCFIYLLSTHASQNSLYYLCIVCGIFCAYQVIIISKIATFVPEKLSGMTAAVANMIIMAFGWVFHQYIGRNMDRLWDGTTQNDIKIYSNDNFVSSISIIPVAMLIAIIGFMVIRTILKRRVSYS
ncbi:MAG: MFS transporter [Rickettsiales bacterium]|nr:MAG: MFS transporter [Rickettsiales bacterium]